MKAKYAWSIPRVVWAIIQPLSETLVFTVVLEKNSYAPEDIRSGGDSIWPGDMTIHRTK